MADVPLQDACNLDGGKGFQRKARNKTPGFVRLTFFLYPAASPDVERVNPSAYVSRCVASAHAACPSCVLTPQLHRTVTLRHKKACKARSVNASCLRPRSLVPVQPTGISSHRDRAAERPTFPVYSRILHEGELKLLSQYYTPMVLLQLGHRNQSSNNQLMCDSAQ